MPRKKYDISKTLNNPIKKPTQSGVLTAYKTQLKRDVAIRLSTHILAAGNLRLSSSAPGTLGYEVEQLFYHGKDLGPHMAIRVTSRDDPMRETVYSPDTYFAQKDWTKAHIPPTRSGYDRKVAESSLLWITLDLTSINDETGVKNYYVPEFVTRPHRMESEVNANMDYFADTVADFYAFCHQSSDDMMSIPQWADHYNKGRGNLTPISTSGRIGEFLTPDIKSEEAQYVIIKKGNDEFDPVFAIHLNTSIYLEQMYSIEMREQFPIFTTYPPIVAKAADLRLKDWPSCRPNEEFELWELSLTKVLNQKVNEFVTRVFENDNRLNAHMKARLEGLLRTLIYSFCIQVYPESGLSEKHFNKEVYETSYVKDFYLHGLPKVNFDYLVLHGLSSAEKAALFDLMNDPRGPSMLVRLYDAIADACDINSFLMACFTSGIEMSPKMMTFATFISETLDKPLRHQRETCVGVVSKVIKSGLPSIPFEGTAVVLPVVEFRAPSGNGCTLAELKGVLQSQTQKATEFAKKGVQGYEGLSPEESVTPSKKW